MLQLLSYGFKIHSGIRDPAEALSRHVLEQAALDHFKETVVTDEDGHYEVS